MGCKPFDWAQGDRKRMEVPFDWAQGDRKRMEVPFDCAQGDRVDGLKNLTPALSKGEGDDTEVDLLLWVERVTMLMVC